MRGSQVLWAPNLYLISRSKDSHRFAHDHFSNLFKSKFTRKSKSYQIQHFSQVFLHFFATPFFLHFPFFFNFSHFLVGFLSLQLDLLQVQDTLKPASFMLISEMNSTAAQFPEVVQAFGFLLPQNGPFEGIPVSGSS